MTIVVTDLGNLFLLDFRRVPDFLADGLDLLSLFLFGQVRILLDFLDALLSAEGHPLDFLLVPARSAGDADALVVDRAGRDVVKTDDASSRRRLSAAGFADKAEAFALLDLEGDIMDGLQPGPLRPLSHGEELLEVVDGKKDIVADVFFLDLDMALVLGDFVESIVDDVFLEFAVIPVDDPSFSRRGFHLRGGLGQFGFFLDGIAFQVGVLNLFVVHISPRLSGPSRYGT